MPALTRISFLFILLINSSLYATDTLRFIGDQTFPTGEKFENTELGGLSGMAYDLSEKKILAISDDKSQANETRFYEFDVTLTEKTFAVKPSKVVKLKNEKGEYFPKSYADFEGISLLGKDILVSSEGSTGKEPLSPSQLYIFSRDGNFKGFQSVPEKFQAPKKDQTDKMYGLRDNQSFEALSSALDGKTVYMGVEEALLQDGPVSTTTYGSTVRILVYKDLKLIKEIGYQLEKVDVDTELKDTNPAMNGLVDIAAIDDKNFYAMERSYLPVKNKNVIRIFKCKITDKTTDLSKLDTLKTAAFVTVEKTLVSDLDEFIPKMNPSRLDNIEAITFGPTLANGNRTLIVASDNNFSPVQRTLFMAFEVLSK